MRTWQVSFATLATAGCITAPPPSPAGAQPNAGVNAAVRPVPPPAGSSSLDYYALTRISLGDAAAPRAPRDDAMLVAPASASDAAAPLTKAGQIRNADLVVAAMRPGFRACYNQGLASNSDLQGSVRITVKIGSKGEVVSVIPSEDDGQLGVTVVKCVLDVVQRAVFSAPEGGAATVVIPITYALSR